MSDSPSSEASDRVNSRQSSPSERLNDIEGELDVECGEESHRPELELHIPLYIETLMGTTFKLEVLPSDTINSIKCKLESVEGIAVSQQHLIWQNQELRNEFTVEDYGMGFGTVLRLVIGLRGGPVSKSPTFFNDSTDVEETISNSDSSQSRPLTVLVFQNGDQIQMFTITSNDSIAANEETFGSSTDLEKTVNIEKDELRLKEDEKLMIKMKEIQTKMKSLSLRRNDCKENKTNVNEGKNSDSNGVEKVTKLPQLETTSSSVRINRGKNRKTTTNIHLPPILNTSIVSEDSSHSRNKSKSKKSSRFQRQLSIIKRVLQSNDTTVTTLKRPNTLSSDKLKDLFGNKISTFKRYSEMWSQLRLLEDNKNSTSTIGSVVSVEDIQRPRTTPFVGRISTNNIPLIAKVSDINVHKGLSSPQLIDREIGGKNIKINSPQKLPSIKTNFKRRTNKTRCTYCRVKLGIVNRYDCRCGLIFCAKHRYSEAHNCSFDYKEEGKRYIKHNNPTISAPKLPKI